MPYEQAVALDPLRTDFRTSLGYLLYVAGRYDKAEAELQKVLELNPQAPRVHFALRKVFIAEGKPQQALVEIEENPVEWGKLTGQALIYHALGREAESNAALAGLSRSTTRIRLIRWLRGMRFAVSPTRHLNGWSARTNRETPGPRRARTIQY